nr:integrase, catalytic region, zinc finger, CCHC-type, peptidase aspartic, catalytic [Tanacetum cinerariifolium]
MLLMQVQENGVALDAEQLLFLAGGPDNAFDDDVDEQPVQDLTLNVDNVFQAEDCDAFDSDVDEAPTAQTMFMANLSSADPITDEAGPSYDSDILSEVQDHDQYLDDTCTYHEEHVMYDNVQLDHGVDLHADYTSVNNMIPYDQEQVELYERRAKFELTEREQKINKQLRLVILDRNFKEETLKRELHSTKLQLASTINRNKSMVEETPFLKQDFKQKENKILVDFLNMKSLKEKNMVAMGYKNPLCLTRAKQAQPALYNGHEILKDNHAPAKVHNTEDTLEIVEITRKKTNAKMTDPEYKDTLDFDSVFVIGKMQASLLGKDNAIRQLKKQLSKLAENDKVKQHYKQLYDSIKITHAKHIEQVTKLTTENVTLKTSVSKAKVQPPVLTRTKHAVDVEPIVPRLRNNRDAHLDYLRHLKESVETICDIVEEAKVIRPLDRSIVSAYRYTRHSQELLEYAIGTCPQGSQQQAKQLAHTPIIEKKQVITTKISNRQDSNKHKHIVTQKTQKTNVPVPHSTGVTIYPKASGSQPKSNPKTNRISPANDAN